MFEIYYGFYYPPLAKEFQNNDQFLHRLEEEQRRLLQFLNDIQVIELTLDAIRKAAEISAQLDANGSHVEKFDTLIAGIILSLGYTKIVTRNARHFASIPGIEVLTFEQEGTPPQTTPTTGDDTSPTRD